MLPGTKIRFLGRAANTVAPMVTISWFDRTNTEWTST